MFNLIIALGALVLCTVHRFRKFIGILLSLDAHTECTKAFTTRSISCSTSIDFGEVYDAHTTHYSSTEASVGRENEPATPSCLSIASNKRHMYDQLEHSNWKLLGHCTIGGRLTRISQVTNHRRLNNPLLQSYGSEINGDR
jgi:hypothetical protein